MASFANKRSILHARNQLQDAHAAFASLLGSHNILQDNAEILAIAKQSVLLCNSTGDVLTAYVAALEVAAIKTSKTTASTTSTTSTFSTVSAEDASAHSRGVVVAAKIIPLNPAKTRPATTTRSTSPPKPKPRVVAATRSPFHQGVPTVAKHVIKSTAPTAAPSPAPPAPSAPTPPVPPQLGGPLQSSKSDEPKSHRSAKAAAHAWNVEVPNVEVPAAGGADKAQETDEAQKAHSRRLSSAGKALLSRRITPANSDWAPFNAGDAITPTALAAALEGPSTPSALDAALGVADSGLGGAAAAGVPSPAGPRRGSMWVAPGDAPRGVPITDYSFRDMYDAVEEVHRSARKSFAFFTK